MRSFFYILACMCVVAVAYWAYNENYATQAANKRVQELQRQIAVEREAIAVLRAEWAYLNRPDRLRELADMNFASLGLVPLTARHFGDIGAVEFPSQVVVDFNEPVSVQGAIQTGGEQ